MPRRSEQRERALTAIPWIIRRFKPAVAAAVFAAASLASLDAAASRVTLLGFEGDRATPLRWRVAQILKRAGHTVLGFKPPRDPDSASELSAYAERRRVDAFVAGSAVEGEDGWTLTLAVRGSNGARLGKPLTFTAPTLGALVQELKGDGQEQLDRAVTRGAAATDAPSGDGGSDAAAELDADEPAAKLTKKKKKKKKKKSRKSRRADPAPEPEVPAAPSEIDLDGASDGEAEAPPSEPAVEDSDAWGRDAGTRPAKKRAKEKDLDEPEPMSTDVDLDGDTSAAEASSAAEPPAAEPEPVEPEPVERAESEASDTLGSGSDESSSPLASDEGEGVGVDEDTSASEKSSTTRWPTLVLGAGAGLVYRNLSFVDNLYGRLREPTTNSVAYKLDAVLYPFARPVKDRLALVASYEATFSGDVKDANLGKSFAVEFSEIAGGVRYRQPLGAHEVSAQTTIGRLSSGLADPDKESRIPRIDYTLVRPSVELGLHFGDVSVRGSLGYRLAIGGFGEVSEVEYFPRMDGYGVDAQAGLRYRFSEEVSFDLSGDMRRFVLNMNSVPDDAIEGRSEVAGGAVDLYLSGYFSLALTF